MIKLFFTLETNCNEMLRIFKAHSRTLSHLIHKTGIHQWGNDYQKLQDQCFSLKRKNFRDAPTHSLPLTPDSTPTSRASMNCSVLSFYCLISAEREIRGDRRKEVSPGQLTTWEQRGLRLGKGGVGT